MKLALSYYQNRDVLFLARDLLGKVLFTQIDGTVTAGIIVETEAYSGVTDKASHAYGGRRTNRTEILYHEGGVSYVYLCYGIHYFFNVVTSIRDEPFGILVRALQPLIGTDIMERRRNMAVSKVAISSGPGSAAKALGINAILNKKSLDGCEIWIEDHQTQFAEEEIVATRRIGIDYAGEHALLPWRFFIRGNKYVSKPRVV